MRLDVFLLVLFAAVMHALWNLAARKASGNTAVMWLGLWVAIAASLPFALSVYPDAPSLQAGWPFILATGILHCFYFLLLSRSYQTGDISFVYPIARGTGVAGTAVVAGVLLNEQVTPGGMAGIVAICVGIFLLGRKASAGQADYRTRSFALLVGVTIVGYSVVDKQGVGHVNPVFYIFVMFLLSAVLSAPYVLARHRNEIGGAWRTMKRYVFTIGLGSIGTYVMILFAFRLGPVSYIVAVREFAVVIGSTLGIVLLGEHLTVRKGLGIAAITVGLVMVKLG